MLPGFAAVPADRMLDFAELAVPEVLSETEVLF
jgi:hypothetical protein